MSRKTVTVSPSPDSAIYWNNHPVVMTDDSVGGVHRLAMHTNSNPQASWLKKIAPDYPCTLVDVGGNVGLYTRQALIAVPNIERVYIYEPDEENYGHLLHNLEPWLDRIVRSNYALASTTGTADFFYDPDNCGNYSLLRSAMGNVPHSHSKINTVNAAFECRRWLDDGRPILYKSDTQGFDEELATLIDPAVWDNVFAAILEIWRIPKPMYDVTAFRKVLDKFSKRTLLPYYDDLTADQVLTFSSETDGRWLDLALTRKQLLPYYDDLTVDEVLTFSSGVDDRWLDLSLTR